MVYERKNLLIIEDDVIQLERYQRYAAEVFDNIYTAISAGETRKIMEKEKIDCIIVDNQLPDTTGLTLIKELGLVRKGIHVILITGFADKEIAIESVNNHLFYFLEKPFKKEHFLEVLESSRNSIEKTNINRKVTEAFSILDKTEDYLMVNYCISKRELEIIALALHGHKNNIIAKNLHLSSGTVKKHLYNIFKKISITSKEELKSLIHTLNRS